VAETIARADGIKVPGEMLVLCEQATLGSVSTVTLYTAWLYNSCIPEVGLTLKSRWCDFG
jgi:hypothetical protein